MKLINNEKFYNYKQKLMDLEFKIQMGNDLLDEYHEILNELLSYDLRNIMPYQWSDMTILTDKNHIADFSNTNANIDFDRITINGYANFKKCRVKNVNRLLRHTQKMIFDDYVYEKYAYMFLSDLFTQDIKDKWNGGQLTFDDIINFDSKQIGEIKQKMPDSHLSYSYEFINDITFDKALELYQYSKDDFNFIYETYKCLRPHMFSSPYEFYLHNQVEKLADHVDYVTTNDILKARIVRIEQVMNQLPESYKKRHEEIFLNNIDMSETIRNKYYSKQLTMSDVRENVDLFKNSVFIYFMTDLDDGIRIFAETIGIEIFRLLIKYHYDVIEFFDNKLYDLRNYFLKLDSNITKERLEIEVIRVIKDYIYYDIDELIENCPSLHLNKVIEYNFDDFWNHQDHNYVCNQNQYILLKYFNTKNLYKLCMETRIFELSNIENIIADIVKLLTIDPGNLNPDIEDYDEFCKTVINWIEKLRLHFHTRNKHGLEIISMMNLDLIDEKFQKKYPSVFMDHQADLYFRELFYKMDIGVKEIYNYKDELPNLLLNKNLQYVIKGNYNFTLIDKKFKEHKANFLEYYSNRFGNEELMKIFTNYGFVLDGVDLIPGFTLDVEMDKNQTDESIRHYIYQCIIHHIKNSPNKYFRYESLKNIPEFYNQFPNLFLTKEDLSLLPNEEKDFIIQKFYGQNIKASDLRKYPILLNILKDKEIKIIINCSYSYGGKYSIENNLMNCLSSEQFLQAYYRYGEYMEKAQDYIDKDLWIMINNKNLSFDQKCHYIEQSILEYCKHGGLYDYEDAPKFLKTKHPELFLSNDAPNELKKVYYKINHDTINFEKLISNPDWLSYLKGKSVSQSFVRYSLFSSTILEYFKLFGEEKGLFLGIKYNHSVENMLHTFNSIHLMHDWYLKTGEKFIPHYVVMQAFDINDADKFLASKRKWSKLSSISEYNQNDETKDALLKLAYTFGVFDNDSQGFNKLYELLTTFPNLSKENVEEISNKDNFNNNYNLILIKLKLNSHNYPCEYSQDYPYEYHEDFKDIIKHIYEPIDDNYYQLKLNLKEYPDIIELLKQVLEALSNYPLLTPQKIHSIFGRFKLEYNSKFKDFLIDNWDEIITNNDYSSNIANIQRNFKQICAINSNRKLTLENALQYVQTIKYDNVDTLNEPMARIASIAGYEQSEFDTLQQIYNYSKQRIYSSIPRIENKTDEFKYEILRLDDPLGLAIGTLTDCCQELGNMAEECMQHSMTSLDGRVFVIRDFEGNIIAQSWVWRNKNTLCFDNIEIPDKVLKRYDSHEISNKVFEIYKLASQEIINEDHKKYDLLLKNKKISQDQYNNLKLAKITVGLGYNDIASVIKKESKVDRNAIHPINENGPINLSHGLYTSDSNTQYILSKSNNYQLSNGYNLHIFSDDYQILNKYTLSKEHLFQMAKFEILKYNYTSYLDHKSDEEVQYMGAIAKEYYTNIDRTKIITGANFAIIYSEEDNFVSLQDIIYNDKVEINNINHDIEKKVIEQIELALKQISINKKININDLDDESKEIYQRIKNKSKQKVLTEN